MSRHESLPVTNSAGAGELSIAEQAIVERDALQRRLDALLNHEVSEWLDLERTLGGHSGDYESTLSWRVTKPLRLVRMFQFAARDNGLGAALRLALTFIARRGRGR